MATVYMRATARINIFTYLATATGRRMRSPDSKIILITGPPIDTKTDLRAAAMTKLLQSHIRVACQILQLDSPSFHLLKSLHLCESTSEFLQHKHLLLS
ncbi:hypothetical protein SAMN02745181_1866 [Rubritalea squalenifaciens DSM 18772]|uniref:Uncharacterized protein n=1 Tax=Rubritalea squalenifaciens DSM 18772 TaxID=1123071 RepID=A0A1M6IN25_9BACT|nr:hypothetical protein [Rubritalea squalenifaciens]SHJ35845.1 hypothetical protein SAMN02745181_1866 [Rubritalea squalenifaciens DSM 18772]